MNFLQSISSNFPKKKRKFSTPKQKSFITVPPRGIELSTLHKSTTSSPAPCMSMAPLPATCMSTAPSPAHCTSTTPSPAPCTSTTPSLAACTSTKPSPAPCKSSCYQAVSTQALIQPYLPVQAQQEGGEGAEGDEGGYREKRERKKSDYAHLGHFQFVAGIILTAATDRRGHIVTIPVLLMQ